MFEAIEFGPFIIWTHAAFLLLGVWLSMEFLLRLAESANLPLQHFRDKALWYVAAFAIGGRIIAVVAEYTVYKLDPLRILIFWDGKFSFLGGMMGIAVVLYLLNRGMRSTFLQWLDVLLPATTFGLFFDWIGKFAAGQGYGRPTNVLWGVTYSAANVRYAVPVHPVQIYYALFFLFLTFLLLVVRKHSARAGAETVFGIAFAAIVTMFLESLRGDSGISIFPTNLDFILLALLFLSLGVFALVEMRLSNRTVFAYNAAATALFVGYLFARPWVALPTYELRFSQFLAVLALLASVVYVVVHRRRYPHL